ncbi:MAG: dihydroneopterin aldolase [Bacteroidales bacterium]|nr:dihydroneopterin aldolase [Bacteroidales bacterium]
MRLQHSHISMEGLRFHACHGVMPQEHTVGGSFVVDVRLTLPLGQAALTDNLADTVNYATVFEIIKHEMSIPSQLLEHVCQRIAMALNSSFPQIEAITICLSKENPPMGADARKVSVEMTFIA